jgi:predicted ester cyclase
VSEAEEKNKALVRCYFEEAWAKGNVAAVDEFMAADYVEHPIPSGLPPGTEGLKQATTTYRTAFPDLKATLDDIFAEGEMVAFRWSVSGTHLGNWLGIPPTGNHVRATGITVFRIAGKKVVEGWTSIAELSPSEEERRWLTEGGGWPRSGDNSWAERDPSSPIWDVLTRNLTWRFRVAEIQERERIEQELRVARRIQQALLPETIPQLDGWEIAQYYQPAREVGGDFYDFLLLADGSVGVVIGDVSGKGIPAAVLMASTQSVLRAVSQRGDPTSPTPGQVLAEANKVLCTYLPANMFVTCFYAILDPESGRLSYANAGHTLPYCRRHDGDREAYELMAQGMPLGLMPGMSYEEKETALLPGDSALFCTDGLVEAHDPKGEMFGSPRLQGLLSARRPESGRGLSATLLLEELRRFTGEEWEQEDDITLLTLERSPLRN